MLWKKRWWGFAVVNKESMLWINMNVCLTFPNTDTAVLPKVLGSMAFLILLQKIICVGGLLKQNALRVSQFINLFFSMSVALFCSSTRWLQTKSRRCDRGGGRARCAWVSTSTWTPGAHHIMEERWSKHWRPGWEDHRKTLAPSPPKLLRY